MSNIYRKLPIYIGNLRHNLEAFFVPTWSVCCRIYIYIYVYVHIYRTNFIVNKLKKAVLQNNIFLNGAPNEVLIKMSQVMAKQN